MTLGRIHERVCVVTLAHFVVRIHMCECVCIIIIIERDRPIIVWGLSRGYRTQATTTYRSTVQNIHVKKKNKLASKKKKKRRSSEYASECIITIIMIIESRGAVRYRFCFSTLTPTRAEGRLNRRRTFGNVTRDVASKSLSLFIPSYHYDDNR